MVNKNYTRGRRKEYSVCDKLKSEGYNIVQRSAGSHSPIDIFVIDIENKIIKLIQVKAGKFSDKEILKIKEDNINLNGKFEVEFIVKN